MTVIGLDIGTTTLCGLLVDAGSGEILSVITEPNSSSMPGSAPWEALQDPETIFRSVSGILGRLRAGRTDIRAVGITGQMHGILYVDSHGRSVSPLATWQDGRGDRDFTPGVTHARFLSQELRRPVSTGMGVVTHHYNVVHNLVPEGAEHLCSIVDYIAMRLAGAEKPITDPTNAAGLGIFNLRAGVFESAEMEKLGMDPTILPTLEKGYPVLGERSPGLSVILGLGDNQASFLGSVRDTADGVLVNVGTGSQISVAMEDAAQIEGLDTRPLPGGGYLAVGAALCGGKAYAALHDFFGSVLRMISPRSPGMPWADMNRIDERALGEASRLRADTRFSGTRADPSLRGSITGLGLDNFTPEHLVVAVRDGIAAELLDFFALIPAPTRERVRTLVGSGNGIRLNLGLRRSFEKGMGLSLRVPFHKEEASFGAALLASVSVGLFPNLAAAGRLIRYEGE